LDWYPWWEYFDLLEAWWQRLEHAFFALAIVVVGWLLYRVLRALRRERLDLEESINTLSEHVRAIKDAADQGSVPPEPTATVEHWEQIRLMWADIRERLEYAISAIGDGRRRRKYSAMSRYSYERITSNLQGDLGLDREVVNALHEMDKWFLHLRRSRAATQKELTWFQTYYRRAAKALPQEHREPD
jgi:hypothetical protein